MDRFSIQTLLASAFPEKAVTSQIDWLTLSCPLAPYTHEGGSDKNPSFGVSIQDDDVSICYCFSCKFKGSFERLFTDLYYHTDDKSWLNFVKDVRDEKLFAYIPDWDSRKRRLNGTDRVCNPIDREILDVYDPVTHHPYLTQRRIHPRTAEGLSLRIFVDEHDGVERILFPVFDLNGELYGFQGRATDPTASRKVMDYYGFNKSLLLGLEREKYNKKDYVILVEGPFDYARLQQYGLPALALLHSNISNAQVAFLKSIAKTVILMLDNDKAGYVGARKIAAKLYDHFPIRRTYYPPGIDDPDQLSMEYALDMVDKSKCILSADDFF